MKTFGAQRRKELAGDWKALLNEEMELHMQKLTFLQSFLVHEFLVQELKNIYIIFDSY